MPPFFACSTRTKKVRKKGGEKERKKGSAELGGCKIIPPHSSTRSWNATRKTGVDIRRERYITHHS